MNMQNYMLKLFPLIVEGMKGELDKDNKKCWIKLPSNAYLAFSRINNLTEVEKQDFVYNIVLVNGFLDSISLVGIEYKRQGARFNNSFCVTIPFDTEQEKKEYFEFRNWVVSIKPTALMLDDIVNGEYI